MSRCDCGVKPASGLPSADQKESLIALGGDSDCPQRIEWLFSPMDRKVMGARVVCQGAPEYTAGSQLRVVRVLAAPALSDVCRSVVKFSSGRESAALCVCARERGRERERRGSLFAECVHGRGPRSCDYFVSFPRPCSGYRAPTVALCNRL